MLLQLAFIFYEGVVRHCISVCAHTLSVSSVREWHSVVSLCVRTHYLYHLSESGTPLYLCVCAHTICIICQ